MRQKLGTVATSITLKGPLWCSVYAVSANTSPNSQPALCQMTMANTLLSFLILACGLSVVLGQIPSNYSVKWYTQKVDHQSYSNSDVFQQRYIISTQHWKPNSPIWFYAGNEGDIFAFANNTGFMWEHAHKFNAMIIFMEHRYYGKSMPYGQKSFSGLSHLGYLTVEQALADYAQFLTDFKLQTPGAAQSPVVVFGGSYGGMLASWFRMKYPHVVIGALAGSAPILQFPGIYKCNQFMDVVTKDFTNYSPSCSSSIRNSWKAIRHVAESEGGRSWLSHQFQLCKPLAKKEDVNGLLDFLNNAWVSMAMTDYSNAANFLNPLPAYPIKHSCKYLTTPNAEERALIKTIYEASSVYYNFTGKTKCYDISSSGDGLGDISGWNFQACTEMVLPICSNGVTDMFEPSPWNLTSYSQSCKQQFGVPSDIEKALILFGGDHIKSATNIIFSNGDRDPWSAGGVLQTLNPTLPAIKISGACHHEDLRASGPNDTQAIKDARIQELNIIKGWQDAYYKENNIVHHF